jgi:glycosyltransferase involved in cell wall biosynthesis
VAIATRNYGRYLPRALMSALRAGSILGLPFEIVVVDDASTDDTREVLERFRLAYPKRIKAFYRTTSRGVAVAKNTALAHCSGRYIAILDSDDEFLPKKLAACFAEVAEGGVDLVTHDFIHWLSPASQPVMNMATWPGREYDFWPPSTWVFPNGQVRFNEQLIGGSEDIEWLLRHRRRLRRRHLNVVLNIQHGHAPSASLTADCLVSSPQVKGRLKGQVHPDDRRAPTVWACGDCGRQLLLPGSCCGRPSVPTPLLFCTAVESPLCVPTPRFSFVFPTRGQVAALQRAVESLRLQLEGHDAELIFVHRGPHDGTLAAIRGWAGSLPVKLIVVPPEEPLSYSRDGNRGARAATGAYLFLANDDIEVCSAGLVDALSAALADLRVGVAGVSGAWNDGRCEPAWDTARIRYALAQGPLAGHFWGCRREVYWELGGLDEAFADDGYAKLDFQYRTLRAQYRLALAAGHVAYEASGRLVPVSESALPDARQTDPALFEQKHQCRVHFAGDKIEPFAGYRPPVQSVVMVAHNAGSALRRGLEAMMADPRHHDGSIQLVVVNNGSQDDTALVLGECQRSLPGLLTVIHLAQPMEASRARALGQARAVGRTVSFSEPGEWIRPPSSTPTLRSDVRERESLLGRWEILPESSEILAVHAALLPTGKVLYFAGSEHDWGQQLRQERDHTRVWDPVTRAVERAGSPAHDLFCAGHAFLGDGKLLTAGGTELYEINPNPSESHAHTMAHRASGLRDTTLFDPTAARGANPWRSAASMNPERGRTVGGGRWYPTVLTLPNGQALAMSGTPDKNDSRDDNTMVELFDPAAGARGRWIDVGEQPSKTFAYPRLHVLPNGQVLCASVMNGQTQKWDPATDTWTVVAESPGAGYDPDPTTPGESEIRWTCVLLPLLPPNYRTRVLVAGREVARIIDLGDRGHAARNSWVTTGMRALPGITGIYPSNTVRSHCNAILLPDATVLIVGGTVDGATARAVLAAEQYDPSVDRWSTLASAGVARVYHSTALLLPDGRVWMGGSNRDGERGLDTRELRMEVFHPPYMFKGPRPEIEAAPEEIRLPSTFAIRTPQAPAVRSVALIRCGSVTHSFNADQRFVGLTIESRTATQLGVASPPDTRIAPPGYYLLFIVDTNGVPSIGRCVRVT